MKKIKKYKSMKNLFTFSILPVSKVILVNIKVPKGY